MAPDNSKPSYEEALEFVTKRAIGTVDDLRSLIDFARLEGKLEHVDALYTVLAEFHKAVDLLKLLKVE